MSLVSADSSVIETIRRRISVRNYDERPIVPEDYMAIEEYTTNQANLIGPFGGKVRLELVRVSKNVSDKGIKLGTYGMIRHPKAYLIGIIGEKSPRTLLDFGYAFEQLVLFLTARGLGTCWLGGTFTRNSFERELELAEGEIIPCITPIGYPKDKQGVLQSALRYMVKADQKKGWEELFCRGSFGKPLREAEAGKFAVPVEMVRLGPSASNKQPWRLVLSEDGRTVHFYLAHTPRYSDTMQRIDMGIAMCHFETACRSQDLKGQWTDADPGLAPADSGTEYIISWEAAEKAL